MAACGWHREGFHRGHAEQDPVGSTLFSLRGMFHLFKPEEAKASTHPPPVRQRLSLAGVPALIKGVPIISSGSS